MKISNCIGEGEKTRVSLLQDKTTEKSESLEKLLKENEGTKKLWVQIKQLLEPSKKTSFKKFKSFIFIWFINNLDLVSMLIDI